MSEGLKEQVIRVIKAKEFLIVKIFVDKSAQLEGCILEFNSLTHCSVLVIGRIQAFTLTMMYTLYKNGVTAIYYF